MTTEIDIKYIPGYKLRIETKDSILLSSIKSYLTIIEYTTYKNPYTHKLEQNSVKVKLYLSANSKNIVIYAGLIEYLMIKLTQLRVLNDIKINILNNKISYEINILEKWINIFKNNPKGIEASNLQINAALTLAKFRGGIAQLYTGSGKGEIICSIADSTEISVLITAPQNPIVDELSLRFKQYGIDVGNEDWTKRINIINPIGFTRSSRFKNEEAIKWLNNVKLLIMDEVHRSSSESYNKLFNTLNNVERSYGFSASPDTVEGKDLSSPRTLIENLGSKLISVIGKCGLSRIQKKLPINISIIKIYCSISNKFKRDDNFDTNWIEILDRTIFKKELAIIISDILKSNPDRLFFIPVHKIESGHILYKNLLSLGLEGFYWDSSLFEPNLDDKLTPLKILKNNIYPGSKYKFLMATSISFDGIDIPALNGIIPLTGVNFRMVIQPCGRAARGTDLKVFLIFDKNNPVLFKQSTNRCNTILNELNVISVKSCSY